MRARARPRSLTRASSRIVFTDSSRARSMKAQVLTTRQSAASARSVISWPAWASMPSMSSESTWFFGQPRVVKWTFMASSYDPTALPGESNSEPRLSEDCSVCRMRRMLHRSNPAPRLARAFILGIALVLTLFAVESAVHSVHHLLQEPDEASACLVATASSHLAGIAVELVGGDLPPLPRLDLTVSFQPSRSAEHTSELQSR